jgi:coproporphyrinogen III oxidase-like Fe-S oxidoreductase
MLIAKTVDESSSKNANLDLLYNRLEQIKQELLKELSK